MQILTLLENALRTNYLPAWQNEINTESTILLNKIDKGPLAAAITQATSPYGLPGNFGFGSEGGSTPVSGGQIYDQFKLTSRDMYSTIGISEKTVRLGRSNVSSVVDVFHKEIEASKEEAVWNQGRTLFMNGTGKLTTVEQQSSASTTFTVATTQYLKEGITVDFYLDDETTPTATRRIKTIDYDNHTITVMGDAFALSDNGFITVQNSYNKEITGLGAIFDKNIDVIYGVSKSENPILYPIEMDAGGDIDNTIIRRVTRRASRERNTKIDLILAGDIAYDAYVTYCEVNNIRVEQSTGDLTGGFKSIKILNGDNKDIEIVCEQFVPKDEMWGVEAKKLHFYDTGWSFATLQGGSAFTLMPGTSQYNALLANYGELLVEKPGGCVRITHCAS
ncbi:MAG: phage major capsid protein [Oscillospiraceae bacterium]|nr:phage major capsid protein [Oscillospiraceae bacterium]